MLETIYEFKGVECKNEKIDVLMSVEGDFPAKGRIEHHAYLLRIAPEVILHLCKNARFSDTNRAQFLAAKQAMMSVVKPERLAAAQRWVDRINRRPIS